MNTVYNNQFDLKKNEEEVRAAVTNDQKTLFYGGKWEKLIQLNIDGEIHAYGSFALQKDSEFLHVFNHYILKAHETGFFNRLYHNYFLKYNENYEMVEPQPLGFNNVMFCFIFLTIGIGLSITKALMEFIMMKLSKQQKWATSTGIREEREREDGTERRTESGT